MVQLGGWDAYRRAYLKPLLVRAAIDPMNGVETAVGLCVPTERNRPCAGLFAELGLEDCGEGRFRLSQG